MISRPFLCLAIALVMFPQIAQTLYSPALADISASFAVSAEMAAQLLSTFFLGFALGVAVWGRVCDRIGRRPAMLSGLALYAAATMLGLNVDTFDALLAVQALAAFGAAVGSVVTQTVLRDRYHGVQLGQVFSVIGIALAASPAMGLFSGASLVRLFGYQGVLGGLLMLSLVLLVWCARALPETLPDRLPAQPLSKTLWRMLKDPSIWCSSFLVAAFNVALFSYYNLAPFQFERLGLSPELFGYSGVILALGSGLGAWLNKRLLARGYDGGQLSAVAAVVLLIGGVSVQGLLYSGGFVVAMLLIVLAFGMAIPNVLGAALVRYGDCLGTAGALFGLFYYVLISGALMLAAWFQALGWTLILCGVLAVCLAGNPARLKSKNQSV
ncbi:MULTISPECIES: MFS transporter [unclassified Pseudomonas]|uniref:MFS transporter n=1 Tax=unclassified Pseudomonas TaxID=196821 RepID=UPI000877173A|nr:MULTISPECIES: MFS transporter [unclassified Pseudomonas]SCZ43595.1 Predicted arabinose efflux permease, MFS family [Pseudomonas sp. NFACC44-2]SDA86210.1 Predicted arabinose efflux permease, MFS family [Pseudomonas sp. NFACC51]SFI51932.1 Predicted arabinose efflux permease, MFS family [Pseudomonas sp. NFACC54]SFT29703.1 Predicted arabinose efflux permease, MFS family [Pseudomonas sp. NFACC48-1]